MLSALNMEKKVTDGVKKYNLLESGDKVLVAVSGGPDSVCLLHLLTKMSQELNFKIQVFHLDHQVRGEGSRQDAEYVKELSASLGVDCFGASFDVPRYKKVTGLSFQEAARRVRLKLLARTAEKAKVNKIAVGHNADDQAETVIMNILRGAGLDGLTGMESLSPFPGETEALIIRPLLEVYREEIEYYCKANKLDYRTDPSNLEPVYLRNKIRLEFLPYIEKNYNPAFKEVFLQMIKSLSRDKSFLTEQADIAYDKLAVEKSGKSIFLDINKLLKYHEAVQTRILRKSLERLEGSLKTIGSKHIASILKLIQGKDPHGSISLPRGIEVSKSYGCLVVKRTRKQKKRKLKGKRQLNIPGKTHISELNLVMEVRQELKDKLSWPPDPRREAYLDYEKVNFPLYVFLRWPGAKFKPLGMEGTKKLKDFLIDEKVPLDERDEIPLVTEKNGEILWVVGKRVAHPYRVTEETSKVIVLKASYL